MIASILLFGGGEASWSQEKIGGAETVINSVQGNLPTGKQAPVVQGDSVFLNEAVSSGADSKANLVLNDNSNVTVGPGSTIKLDDFVYSGAKAAWDGRSQYDERHASVHYRRRQQTGVYDLDANRGHWRTRRKFKDSKRRLPKLRLSTKRGRPSSAFVREMNAPQ